MIIQFLVEGKRQLYRDPSIIRLAAFEFGVFGELGARRFLGPKWVRAKDAKDAKVRKAITEMSIDHAGPKWVRAKDAKGAKVRKAITEMSIDHAGPKWVRAKGAKGAKDAKVRKGITELSLDHTGPKRVRAKDAKDAKVRKAITELSFDHTGWWALWVAGVTGFSESGYMVVLSTKVALSLSVHLV